MYVCICNALTDHEIAFVSAQGARTVNDAYKALGAEVCCGQCRCAAQGIIDECCQTRPLLQAAE